MSIQGDPGRKEFQTRHKEWHLWFKWQYWLLKTTRKCDGIVINYICNFGTGDLIHVTQAKQLFANKFRMEFDALAFECMEEWYMNRTKRTLHPDFDITFYQTQPWVKNHI